MKNLADKAEVAILNYPQLPILLQRGNGIKDAVTKLAPNAKIVAETSAINPAEGISKMETIFQANPDVKVVGCIGAGGSVGPMKRQRQQEKSQTTSVSSPLMQHNRNFSLSRTMRASE
jgi:ABC-type sugar transport system, periplasmic component